MSQDKLRQKIEAAKKSLFDAVQSLQTQEDAILLQKQIGTPLGVLVAKFDIELPNLRKQIFRKSKKFMQQNK